MIGGEGTRDAGTPAGTWTRSERPTWINANLRASQDAVGAIAFHERNCIHEAGHAVAAFGVGAFIHFGEVAPAHLLRGDSGYVRAEVEGLENRLTIFVAGELATDPAMPVATIIRVGNDMRRARERVAAHLYPDEEKPDLDRLEPQLSPYLERAALRVRPWLAQDEQQRAIKAIARALTQASETNDRVLGHDIVRICEECGVEPACLRLLDDPVDR